MNRTRQQMKWIDDYGSIVALASWLPSSPFWEHMSAAHKLDELLHFLEKPWNYDNEYLVMTHEAFACADCGAIEGCESETQAEHAEAGDAQYCADCDEERRVDAMAPPTDGAGRVLR